MSNQSILGIRARGRFLTLNQVDYLSRRLMQAEGVISMASLAITSEEELREDDASNALWCARELLEELRSLVEHLPDGALVEQQPAQGGDHHGGL
jgi:hypothetical protein